MLLFSKLSLMTDIKDTELALRALASHLEATVQDVLRPMQRELFPGKPSEPGSSMLVAGGRTVSCLRKLVAEDFKLPNIYADPPWSYDNDASRGAAANHYPTMSIDEICSEPVGQLAQENAHLHLWTTNAILRNAFDVIDAWGFRFKSCLIWTKSEIGMGNYWRVSHEFLRLGVRGSPTFRDRTLPSWIKVSRSAHSRKPSVVRSLIERTSPPPYLELYGREELPNSSWTVYGNQVVPRLF